MVTYARNVVDIVPAQTHIEVLANQSVVFRADHARAMAIDGVSLTVVSDKYKLWQWHAQRKIGHHVLVLECEYDDDIQLVAVGCADESLHHEFVTALRDHLYSIDPRLCLGQYAWQSIGLQRSVFESLMGMTSESFLSTVHRLMQSQPMHTLHEWQGDRATELRMDRLAVRDGGVVPLANDPTVQPGQRTSVALMYHVIDRLESMDSVHVPLTTAIRQRLFAPISITPVLRDLLRRADDALALSRRSIAQGDMQQTADISLLYERWVWISVLHALGCDLVQIPSIIDSKHIYTSRTGVMCAYQRRLAPVQAVTGWSRDGRVAVPDVMLWQMYDESRCRALIIDAKCSLGARTPNATALNDVTAYLRRVGVGGDDPDGAMLVHPGDMAQQWPSGLTVVGTHGIVSEVLAAVVHNWVNSTK